MGKVLYVEDDSFLSKALSKRMEDAGLEVMLAKDGDEALSVVEDNAFDVIILDLLIPGKSGFEVLEEFKKNEQTKSVPVVVLSNLSSDEDIQKTKQLGAHDHFVKATIDPRKVVSYIQTLIK